MGQPPGRLARHGELEPSGLCGAQSGVAQLGAPAGVAPPTGGDHVVELGRATLGDGHHVVGADRGPLTAPVAQRAAVEQPPPVGLVEAVLVRRAGQQPGTSPDTLAAATTREITDCARS